MNILRRFSSGIRITLIKSEKKASYKLVNLVIVIVLVLIAVVAQFLMYVCLCIKTTSAELLMDISCTECYLLYFFLMVSDK